MRNFVWAAGVAVALLGSSSSVSAQATSPLTDEQKAVWQGEENYWKYVNARDLKGYLTLWYPTFRGWPCNTEHPADLSGLEQWAAQWFSEKAKAGQFTTPEVEGVVVDSGFAITYLSGLTVWTSPDGVKHTKLEKFVHTWKATPGGWKIIGGMCAPLDRSETSGSERGR